MKDLKVCESGLVPVYENKKEERLVNARELHEFLEVGRDFTTWIKDKIEKYNFIEGVDYLLTKIGEQLPSGTKYKSEYILKLDVAKEIAMVENNEKGRTIRKYFIAIEERHKLLTKKQRKLIAQREAGIMIRNMLTDIIRDKIPESPHKCYVYPNYTRLIYKILFNKTVEELRAEKLLDKKQNLRDHFNVDELNQIQQLENVVTGLIALGMGYEEIKTMLQQRYIKQLA